MAPVLHERVLPVRGFGNQRQIGLIIDKGTKALSKNRMIIDGQNADRCGGNVHARCLVMRCEFPLQSLYQGSRLRGITVTGYKPPTWLRKCGNISVPRYLEYPFLGVRAAQA